MLRVVPAIALAGVAACAADGSGPAPPVATASSGVPTTSGTDTDPSTMVMDVGEATRDIPAPPGMPGCDGLGDALVLPAISGAFENVCDGGAFGQLVEGTDGELHVCVGDAGVYPWATAEPGRLPGEAIVARYFGAFTYWDPAKPNQADPAEPKYILIEATRYANAWGLGCASAAGFEEHGGSRVLGGDIEAQTPICDDDDAFFTDAADPRAIDVVLSSGERCSAALHRL